MLAGKEEKANKERKPNMQEGDSIIIRTQSPQKVKGNGMESPNREFTLDLKEKTTLI